MRISAEDGAFYHGILAALAVVVVHDEETIYREIVNSVDKKKLLAVAKADEGTAEWSGLIKYRYCRKPRDLRR